MAALICPNQQESIEIEKNDAGISSPIEHVHGRPGSDCEHEEIAHVFQQQGNTLFIPLIYFCLEYFWLNGRICEKDKNFKLTISFSLFLSGIYINLTSEVE